MSDSNSLNNLTPEQLRLALAPIVFITLNNGLWVTLPKKDGNGEYTFIEAHVLRKLHEQGYEVSSLDDLISVMLQKGYHKVVGDPEHESYEFDPSAKE